jgi:histidinol-phosphatase (PHP family)
MALELNTSGYFQNPQEPYPCRQILEMAYEAGIRKVTIGSDCHEPKNLGRGIHQGRALLKEVGFKEITFFRKGVPSNIEI